MTKLCTKCSIEKPWAEFYAAKKWADGSMRRPLSWCKACMRELSRDRQRQYRAEPDHERWQPTTAEQRRRILEAERFRAHGRRRQQGIAERPRKRGKPGGGDVPAAPFAAWLSDLLEREGSIERLALLCRMAPETISRILDGGREFVYLDTVDGALCSEGSMHLRELYPEVYEMVA